MIILLWLGMGLVCLGAPALYFAYMKTRSERSWNLTVERDYRPTVTIIIPTYNEDPVIRYKLQNLAQLDYPRDKLQILIVDSASTDLTLDEINDFKKECGCFNIVTIQEKERKGKSSALNHALRQATNEIIIVSDADCFWPNDILKQALPYLADKTVGAVAGQEKLVNPNQSWVTRTEDLYRNTMFKIQLGESKYYSTVQFEGGFGAFDRSHLTEFDTETGSDDSGTALDLIQKGVRTIALPEATFYTFFPPTWKGKMKIKVRRAKQFVRIWSKCFRLLLQRKLVLPKTIFLSQAFLFFVNPIISFAFLALSVIVILDFQILALIPLFLFLFPRTRILLVEFLQNNLIALLAITETAMGKRSIIWAKAEDSRQNIDTEALKKLGLIS